MKLSRAKVKMIFHVFLIEIGFLWHICFFGKTSTTKHALVFKLFSFSQVLTTKRIDPHWTNSSSCTESFQLSFRWEKTQTTHTMKLASVSAKWLGMYRFKAIVVSCEYLPCFESMIGPPGTQILNVICERTFMQQSCKM